MTKEDVALDMIPIHYLPSQIVNIVNKKKAFQWDAYHPLTERIYSHASVATRYQLQLGMGVGLQVNKFERVSSLCHLYKGYRGWDWGNWGWVVPVP